MISVPPTPSRAAAAWPVAARIALAAVLAALIPPAEAGVFKCLRDDHRVFYQENPCPPGRELRDFDKNPGNVSVIPFAPGRPAVTPPHAKPPRTARAVADKRAPRKRAEAKGDASERRFLRPGMSEGEVIARVGSPDMTARRGRKSVRWTYMPVPEDRDTITSLVFENGHVAEVERKVIKK
jgi:hypothetical protein